MSTTPNMNLTLPTPSTTPGPLWATQVNSAFSVVDQHNHTFGSGVQVPTAGLNINSDLSFNGYSAINLKGSVYADVQGVAPVATGQIYVNNGDLYFLDGSGTAIPITVAGAIAGTPGDISNLLPPAVAAWDIGSASFIFTQNTNQAASFDIGPVTIRRTSVSSFGVTLEPASGIGANYTLSLPTALPAGNSFLTANAAGAIGYISQSGGITKPMLAAQTVAVSSTNSQSFSTASTSLTNVTDSIGGPVAVTITTSGRPICIKTFAVTPGLGNFAARATTGSGGTYDGGISVAVSVTGSASATLSVCTLSFQTGLTVAGTSFQTWPASSVDLVATVGAGTYTFTLQVAKTAGASVGVNDVSILAYEM